MVFCKHVRFSWWFQRGGRCNLFYSTVPKWSLSRRFTTALKKKKEIQRKQNMVAASRWISLGSLREINLVCLPYETLETTNLLICNPVLHKTRFNTSIRRFNTKISPTKAMQQRDFIIRARSFSSCWIHMSNPADYEQIMISQNSKAAARASSAL